jgi:hypothetical protein
MSDPDRLRDLPSVDRLATAVARADLQARREEMLNGTDAGDDTTVDLRARARARARVRAMLRPMLRARDRALVGPIHDGRLLLDPRRLPDDEAREVVRAALP